MKTTKMNRIDFLKKRIAEMQKELELLKVSKFKTPTRCTEATVNAALEAGGSDSRVGHDERGFFTYTPGIAGPHSRVLRHKTAKEAFEVATGIALQKYRAGLPG